MNGPLKFKTTSPQNSNQKYMKNDFSQKNTKFINFMADNALNRQFCSKFIYSTFFFSTIVNNLDLFLWV